MFLMYFVQNNAKYRTISKSALLWFSAEFFSINWRRKLIDLIWLVWSRLRASDSMYKKSYRQKTAHRVSKNPSFRRLFLFLNMNKNHQRNGVVLFKSHSNFLSLFSDRQFRVNLFWNKSHVVIINLNLLQKDLVQIILRITYILLTPHLWNLPVVWKAICYSIKAILFYYNSNLLYRYHTHT